MQGKLASSEFDFGYTEQFCIPGVTSGFFSSCDSVVGDLWSSDVCSSDLIGTSISVKQQDEKPGYPISSGDES